MLNKKIVKSILLVGLVLVCVVGFSPKARAITASELQTQITALLAQLASLQQQLAGIQGNQGVAWCHSFNANLRIGDKGSEIQELVKALGKENILMQGGCSEGGACQSFDEYVASIVSEFQEKYASEILKSYGLKHGTGFVGVSTRAKLNKLYGCNNQPVACTADAKQCPDGSYVSRVAPSCKFAPCPTTSCIKEGQSGSYAGQVSECCAGLSAITNQTVIGSSCSTVSGTIFVCAKCGDGVCGLGENKCNCPQDCKDTAATTACTDSDGYKNFYAKGSTYGRFMGEIKSWEDYCVGNNDYAYDFTCRTNVYPDSDALDVWADSLACPAGCVDGACQRLSLIQPSTPWSSYSVIKWKADLEAGSKVNLDLINQTCLNNLATGTDKEQCIKAIYHGLNPEIGVYSWTNVIMFMSGNFTTNDEYRVRIQEIKSIGAFGAEDQSENTFKVWL